MMISVGYCVRVWRFLVRLLRLIFRFFLRPANTPESPPHKQCSSRRSEPRQTLLRLGVCGQTFLCDHAGMSVKVLLRESTELVVIPVSREAEGPEGPVTTPKGGQYATSLRS